MTTDNPTTPEMIERVAKEIEAALPASFFKAQAPGYLACDFPLNAYWFREAARAAIAAMREPTEAMIREGMDANDLLTEDQVLPAYQSMIDAALGE